MRKLVRKIEIKKFNIKLSSFHDLLMFNSVCLKFSECITYTIGNYSVDAKSFKELTRLSHGKIAIVSINTENTRLIDEFEYHIQPWLLPKQKVGE